MFLGYRWYDSREIEPQVPFGHGLSYTTFDYLDVQLRLNGDAVAVTVTVQNSGARAGQEVVQVYVAPPAAGPLQRPPQELKAFSKVGLAAGESVAVELLLEPRDFAVWDTGSEGWLVLPGDYEIRIGASSRDIRLRAPWMIREPLGLGR